MTLSAKSSLSVFGGIASGSELMDTHARPGKGAQTPATAPSIGIDAREGAT